MLVYKEEDRDSKELGFLVFSRQMASHVVLARKGHRADRAEEAPWLSALDLVVAIAVVAPTIAAAAFGTTERRFFLGFHHLHLLHFRIFIL